MNDDLFGLETLAPSDPSAAAPGWRESRRRIHDEVLSDGIGGRRYAPWQVVLGVAASILLVVAATGIIQQLGRTPIAIPAETPSPTTASAPLLDGAVVLTGSGDVMELCWGIVPTEENPPSLPPTARPPAMTPSCRGERVAVTGLTWEDIAWANTVDGVRWAAAAVTGTFSGTGFAATRALAPSDPEAASLPTFPQLPAYPDSLCTDPESGKGSGDANDVLVANQSLTGFLGWWMSPEPHVLNVAFAADQVEAGRKVALATFDGPVCVGTIPGPSYQAIEAARVAAEKVPGVQATELRPTASGNHLEVLVLHDGSKPSLAAALGDAWEFTLVTPIFTPVTVTRGTTASPRGDDATWVLADPSEVSRESTTVRVAVMRLGCNGGRTGEVLPPEVSVADDQITIRTDVVKVPGGSCPGNDSTEVVVHLPEPIGDRQLVDAYCLSEWALESICQRGAVRWSPSGTERPDIPTVTSAPPTDPTQLPTKTQAARHEASGTLFDRAGSPWLCVGLIFTSNPPGCARELIPLAGISWDDIPWAERSGQVIWADAWLQGTFDGTTLAVDSVTETAPTSPPSASPRFGQACESPIQGTGTGTDHETLANLANKLPGYMGLWFSPDQQSLNVAVQRDAEAAATTLTAQFGGRFCVVQLAGPSAADVEAASARLETSAKNLGLLTWGGSISRSGAWMEVGMVYPTPDSVAKVRDLIGPAAASSLRVVGAIRTIGLPFELYTHCGIRELTHDGKWYAREGGPVDDGQGNPPPGWDNPAGTGQLVLDGDRAIFTDGVGHYEVFLLRPGATSPLEVCD